MTRMIKEGELTAEQIVERAKSNHIWLNAFSCVNPSDDFLRDVGQTVLDIVAESDIRDDLIGRLPVAYIRINRS